MYYKIIIFCVLFICVTQNIYCQNSDSVIAIPFSYKKINLYDDKTDSTDIYIFYTKPNFKNKEWVIFKNLKYSFKESYFKIRISDSNALYFRFNISLRSIFKRYDDEIVIRDVIKKHNLLESYGFSWDNFFNLTYILNNFLNNDLNGVYLTLKIRLYFRN